MAEKTENGEGNDKRIQLEFPPNAVDRLDRIKQKTSSGSYAELVRNALRAYEWIIKTQKKGFQASPRMTS